MSQSVGGFTVDDGHDDDNNDRFSIGGGGGGNVHLNDVNALEMAVAAADEDMHDWHRNYSYVAFCRANDKSVGSECSCHVHLCFLLSCS
jgi:hypothetical protein